MQSPPILALPIVPHKTLKSNVTPALRLLVNHDLLCSNTNSRLYPRSNPSLQSIESLHPKMLLPRKVPWIVKITSDIKNTAAFCFCNPFLSATWQCPHQSSQSLSFPLQRNKSRSTIISLDARSPISTKINAVP